MHDLPMTWIGDRVHDPALRDTYLEVQELAGWSDWMPFPDAMTVAPREPGVYLFRDS